MSRLFDSFRSIGLVASGKPSEVRHMGTKDFMTVPCGRSFFVYDMQHISVSLISRQISHHQAHEISNVCCGDNGDTTFCSAGNTVFMFKRAEQVGKYEYADQIDHLLLLGTALIAVLCNGQVFVDRVLKLELGSAFQCRFVLHPHTYLNKLVFVGAGGLAQLWNFSTGKLVHTFACLQQNGGGGGEMECGEQSPILDVCAFGSQRGRISLVNLKHDVELFALQHTAKQAITALAFHGDSRLYSASHGGDLCEWDLEKQCMMRQVPQAHSNKRITRLSPLGQDLLVSVGDDNAIKCWDLHELVVVRQREGHSAPPHKVVFHPMGSTLQMGDSDGRQLQMLTLGQDRQVRTFHVIRDTHNRSLSAKKKHLAMATSVSTSEARENDWFNVVTTHDKQSFAQVWRFEHAVMHDHGLNIRNKQYGKLSKRKSYGASDRDCNAVCTSSCISACGNFCFVGNATGLVAKYNLQSGRFLHCFPQQEWQQDQEVSRKRQRLPPGSVFASAGEADQPKVDVLGKFVDADERHQGPVCAVVLDGLDETLITAGSTDRKLKAWDSSTGELVQTVELPANAQIMQTNKEGGLCCVVMENQQIWIVDTASLAVVRKFAKVHRAKITAVCFASNSKWLLTSSMDGTVKVFDLISAVCIEHLQFASPVTSMSFSPNNEFLVTSHVDSVALCVWTNKVHFFGGAGQPSIHPSSKPAIKMDMPVGGGMLDEDDEEEEEAQQQQEEMIVVKPVEPTGDVDATITLQESTKSTSSRWYTLVHLDSIKQRNKPVQAPEKPEQAPFFLPDLANPLSSSADNVFAAGEESRILFEPANKRNSSNKQGGAEAESVTALVLQGSDNMQQAMLALEKLSPSAVDFELLSNVNSEEDCVAWLQFILYMLETEHKFDMTQAVLNRLLRLHVSEFIATSGEVRQLVEQVLVAHKNSWKRLQSMLHKTQCFVESFSHVSGF